MIFPKLLAYMINILLSAYILPHMYEPCRIDVTVCIIHLKFTFYINFTLFLATTGIEKCRM